jgi:hypothetical protein
MNTVKIRSKYGASEITATKYSPLVVFNKSYNKTVYKFNLDNNFTNSIPSAFWERIKEEWYDRKLGTRYKEMFEEL